MLSRSNKKQNKFTVRYVLWLEVSEVIRVHNINLVQRLDEVVSIRPQISVTKLAVFSSLHKNDNTFQFSTYDFFVELNVTSLTG